VRLYKELSEVARAFANLKDVIDLRPIYHRTDDRVQAHIFVAALAFLLHRAIERNSRPLVLISPRPKPSPPSNPCVPSKSISGTKPPNARSLAALNAPRAYCAHSEFPNSIHRLRPNQGKPSCSDKSP
jgi:hypothetical protein